MGERLAGPRVLVTEANDFMGPAVIELFSEEGAEVVADQSDLRQDGRCEELVSASGQVDVLIANLSIPNPPLRGRLGCLNRRDKETSTRQPSSTKRSHPTRTNIRLRAPREIDRMGPTVLAGSSIGVPPGLATGKTRQTQT
jgi:hypothetical protein